MHVPLGQGLHLFHNGYTYSETLTLYLFKTVHQQAGRADALPPRLDVRGGREPAVGSEPDDQGAHVRRLTVGCLPAGSNRAAGGRFATTRFSGSGGRSEPSLPARLRTIQRARARQRSAAMPCLPPPR